MLLRVQAQVQIRLHCRNCLQQALKLKKGSGVPNRDKVGKISMEQVKEIAEKKMADLNTKDIDQACKIVMGSCRSMGVDVLEA